jgi:Uncharacterized protein involved in chromosome partitioning
MASIYENIKSAKELVKHVMAHGISTKDEDIVVAQDIIGHSTIEELDELANDIGMEDRNGNPDPKGTIYSGKRGTRDTFYFILFHVWSWEDATRFWNQHTNLEHEELETLRSEKKAATATIEKLTRDLEAAKSTLHTEANMVQTANTSLAAAEKRAADAEAEVIRLKAKLYDMMTANK